MTLHAINKEIFEFTCESEAIARKLQQEIDVYLAPQFHSIMEQVLSQHAGDDERIIIDTVEIDLGTMRLEDMGKDEILKKFSEALEEKMQSIHAEHTRHHHGSNGGSRSSQTEWEMMSSMIKQGDLPWWADKNQAEDIDLLLHRLFQKDRRMARSFLEQQRRNAPALFRLASQYKPSTRKLIDELMPGVLPAFLRANLFGTAPEEAAVPTLSPELLTAIAAFLGDELPAGARTDRSALLDKLVRKGAVGWLESPAFVQGLSDEDRATLRTFIGAGSRSGRPLRQRAMRSVEKLSVFQALFLTHYLSVLPGKEDNNEVSRRGIVHFMELDGDMPASGPGSGPHNGEASLRLPLNVIPGTAAHPGHSGGPWPQQPGARSGVGMPDAPLRQEAASASVTARENGNGGNAASGQESGDAGLYPTGRFDSPSQEAFPAQVQTPGVENQPGFEQQSQADAAPRSGTQAAGTGQPQAGSVEADQPAAETGENITMDAAGKGIDKGVNGLQQTINNEPRLTGEEPSNGLPQPAGEAVNRVPPAGAETFNRVAPVDGETPNQVRVEGKTPGQVPPADGETSAVWPGKRQTADPPTRDMASTPDNDVAVMAGMPVPLSGEALPMSFPGEDVSLQALPSKGAINPPAASPAPGPAAIPGDQGHAAAAGAVANGDVKPGSTPSPTQEILRKEMAGRAVPGKISFIMKRLNNNDPAMLRYLLQLPRKDLDRLHGLFSKGFRKAIADKKRISHLLDHPYLLQYNLLNVYANLSLGDTPGAAAGQVTAPYRRASAKAGVLADVANRIRFAQAAFLAMAETLSPTEALVIRDILEKRQFDTASEKKAMRKLLQQIPAESLRVLDFLTGLEEEAIRPLVASVQGSRRMEHIGMPFTRVTPAAQEKMYIENAGLCLVALYLPGLFNNLGYIENRVFKNKAYALKALCVTQYLATGNPKTPEFLLQLNKLLTGFEPEEPIPAAVRLTKKEMAETDSLIESVVANWKALKNTSVEGFRTAFLQRKGILFEKGGCWTLQVEKKGHDVLLNNIPWGFSMIKLPWMKKMIQVEW